MIVLWVTALVAGCGDAAPASNSGDSAAAVDAPNTHDNAVAASDAPAAETSGPEVADAAPEMQVSYKMVTGATKVTKQTTSASYTLTLVGPMALHVGDDGQFDLTVEAGGPVKFLSPKVSFTQAQVGTKGLLPPKLVAGTGALTYRISGVVPAATGKWKLAIDVKDGDSAEFEIDVGQ